MLKAAALLICVAGPVLAQNRVPKWSTYELRLTAKEASDNPYADPRAGVTATFNGPGGVSLKVAGFWDGGAEFVVRFTPTAEGKWSYRTTSPDPGLNGKEGTLTATAAEAGSRGFLRIDAEHPSSFVWDNGARYFMWGQSYYDVMQPALVNDNWKTSAARSLAYGMNKVRMHVFAQNYYKPNVEYSKYPDAAPYLGDSRKLDRDRLNIAYFRKLDEIVRKLGEMGMVADLIVTNPYWGNRQFGAPQQNDRFVRYIAARYAAFPNVIWCLANEWDVSVKRRPQPGAVQQGKADFDRMGKLLRASDPWMAEGKFLRPLSIHNTDKVFEYYQSGWPTHVIIQYGGWNKDFDNGDQWGNAGIVHNLVHKMPVVNDEYGYIGQANPRPPIRLNMTRERLRGAQWGIAMAGGYGSAGDFRQAANGMGNVEITGDWLDAPEEYGDLKRMIDFFTNKGIEYWKMSSSNGLVTAGTRVYVLAEAGRQYCIYAAVGGDFAVNLAPGKYQAWRYDPLDGAETSLGAVSGGAARFSLPSDHDYTVRVTRALE
jgi:hypothetical protein